MGQAQQMYKRRTVQKTYKNIQKTYHTQKHMLYTMHAVMKLKELFNFMMCVLNVWQP